MSEGIVLIAVDDPALWASCGQGEPDVDIPGAVSCGCRVCPDDEIRKDCELEAVSVPYHSSGAGILVDVVRDFRDDGDAFLRDLDVDFPTQVVMSIPSDPWVWGADILSVVPEFADEILSHVESSRRETHGDRCRVLS